MRRQTKDGNLTAATLCKVREKLRDADLLSENGYVALGLHIDAALHAPFNAGVLANLAGAIQDALLRAHSPFALAPELKAAGEAAAAPAGGRPPRGWGWPPQGGRPPPAAPSRCAWRGRAGTFSLRCWQSATRRAVGENPMGVEVCRCARCPPEEEKHASYSPRVKLE